MPRTSSNPSKSLPGHWEGFLALCLLLIHMNNIQKPWVPVLYATLTAPDWATAPAIWSNTERWLIELRNATKCHIDSVSGYEEENLHTHNIVLVPENELERFHARHFRFKSASQGHWRQKVEPFEMSLLDRCWSYCVDKHTQIQFDLMCPGQAHRCRTGRCPHREWGANKFRHQPERIRHAYRR